jgi:allantoinase
MDHALYRYEPLPAADPPAGAVQEGADGRLHAFVVLCLEHWDFVAAEGAVRDPRFVGEFGSFSPDYRSWTQREYGLRVGVFRVIDALAQAGIRPAVAANARALRRLPRLVARLDAWGCEWIAHGIAANDLMHARMPLEAQRRHVAASIDAIAEATGRRPLGWLSQDWGTSPDTFRLLAETGIGYTLDWTNDDRPYRMTVEPPLLSIPLSAEWDDVQCQWLRAMEPQAHRALALEAFLRLRDESARHRRLAVFGLALHPWVSGMSSRIGALRGLLDDLRREGDVAWVTPGELCRPVPPATGSATT